MDWERISVTYYLVGYFVYFFFLDQVHSRFTIYYLTGGVVALMLHRVKFENADEIKIRPVIEVWKQSISEKAFT